MNELIGRTIVSIEVSEDTLGEQIKAVITLDNEKTVTFEAVMVDWEDCGLSIEVN